MALFIKESYYFVVVVFQRREPTELQLGADWNPGQGVGSVSENLGSWSPSPTTLKCSLGELCPFLGPVSASAEKRPLAGAQVSLRKGVGRWLPLALAIGLTGRVGAERSGPVGPRQRTSRGQIFY